MVSTNSYKSQISLPKLSIDLNSRIQVSLDIFQSPQRTFQGEFLGVQHYDFFMVRMTLTPGIKSILTPKIVAEIRYSQDGAVNSFRTEVITYTYKPSLVLFFAYPDKVTVVNVRRVRRLPCRLPAFIQGPHGDGKGLILDISEGGCLISYSLSGNASLRNLKKEDKIIVKAAFSPESPASSCTAVIKKVDTSGGCMTLGVSFEDCHDGFLSSLAEYYKCIEGVVGS